MYIFAVALHDDESIFDIFVCCCAETDERGNAEEVEMVLLLPFGYVLWAGKALHGVELGEQRAIVVWFDFCDQRSICGNKSLISSVTNL